MKRSNTTQNANSRPGAHLPAAVVILSALCLGGAARAAAASNQDSPDAASPDTTSSADLPALNGYGNFEPVGDYSEDRVVQFFHTTGQGQQISGLKWDPDEPSLYLEPQGEHYRISVKIHGKHPLLEWKLTIDGKKIAQESDGGFTLRVPINGVETVKRLEGRGPQGEFDSETIKIRIPRFDDIRKGQISRNPLRPSFDLSRLSYNQNGIAAYSQFALAAGLIYDLPLSSRTWIVGASGTATLLPFAQSDSTISARIFGGNLHFGARTDWLGSPWSLSFFLGFYYSTMVVTNDLFGYRDLYGPQFYPVLARALGLNDDLQLTFRVSPVSDGWSILSLDNHEVSAGFSWNHIFSNGHSLSFNLIASSLMLNLSGQSVNSTSVSAGPGFEW